MKKNVQLRVNHPNGKRWILTVEKKGKIIITKWDKEGNMYSRDIWSFNTGDGILRTWNPNGQIALEEVYNVNGSISTVMYDDNGDVI